MTLGKSLTLLGPFRGEQADPGEDLNYVYIINLKRQRISHFIVYSCTS